jgi:hypothetical protein
MYRAIEKRKKVSYNVKQLAIDFFNGLGDESLKTLKFGWV